jgi:hypothetical protein
LTYGHIAGIVAELDSEFRVFMPWSQIQEVFMKAKRKTRTTLQPLAEAIAQDARNKRALDKQFLSFYKQMKKAISSSKEMKELEVPLEKVKESIQLAAFGGAFGIPMVTVERPKDWED